MILLIMQYTLFSKEIFFNSKIIMLKDEFYSGAKKKPTTDRNEKLRIVHCSPTLVVLVFTFKILGQ